MIFAVHARKRFGQHFLCDEYTIQEIVNLIAPQAEQHVVEIGPGLGALTEHLWPRVKQLTLIEIDRDIIPRLQRVLHPAQNVHLLQADALQFDFKTLQPKPFRVCGNLPYNISTPLLFHLLNYLNLIQDMHFMLQKEVVARLCAEVNTAAYGRLSIMVQYYCQVIPLLDVPPSAFTPPPRVDSCVVRLIPHAVVPAVAKDFNHFADIVRKAFTLRRKTLRNVFKGVLGPEQFELLGLNPMLRPEQLAIADYVRISNMLSSQ